MRIVDCEIIPNFVLNIIYSIKKFGDMKRFLLALFAFTALEVSAQTPTAEEQAAQIAALTEQVNQLETKSQKWDKALAALPKISAYVQGRYSYADDESSFRLRRVRLNLSGAITPKIDYKFQAELASFKLLDAYFDYKPFEQFKIKAGQFKVPLSMENTDDTPKNMLLIDYSMAMQRLVGCSEKVGDATIKATGRATGLGLHGTFCEGAVAYDLALFNGTDLNTVDNNKSKDIVGRLTLRPVAGWSISGSYYWGEFDEEYYTRERWVFGTGYDDGKIVARAEYFGGKTGLLYDTVDAEGWYLLGGYYFCQKWSAAVRYDTYCEKATEHYPKFEQSNYTVGLAWSPVKNIRIQANYVYEDHLVGHRNLAMVQFTAGF